MATSSSRVKLDQDLTFLWLNTRNAYSAVLSRNEKYLCVYFNLDSITRRAEPKILLLRTEDMKVIPLKTDILVDYISEVIFSPDETTILTVGVSVEHRRDVIRWCMTENGTTIFYSNKYTQYSTLYYLNTYLIVQSKICEIVNQEGRVTPISLDQAVSFSPDGEVLLDRNNLLKFSLGSPTLIYSDKNVDSVHHCDGKVFTLYYNTGDIWKDGVPFLKGFATINENIERGYFIIMTVVNEINLLMINMKTDKVYSVDNNGENSHHHSLIITNTLLESLVTRFQEIDNSWKAILLDIFI